MPVTLVVWHCSNIVCEYANQKCIGGGIKVYGREGSSVQFDWTPTTSATIKWAAIYAGDAGIVDTPLTQFLSFNSGYRAVIAYNLYVTEGVHTGPFSVRSMLDPTQHPFYQNIQEIFRDGYFMKQGINENYGIGLTNILTLSQEEFSAFIARITTLIPIRRTAGHFCQAL